MRSKAVLILLIIVFTGSRATFSRPYFQWGGPSYFQNPYSGYSSFLEYNGNGYYYQNIPCFNGMPYTNNYDYYNPNTNNNYYQPSWTLPQNRLNQNQFYRKPPSLDYELQPPVSETTTFTPTIPPPPPIIALNFKYGRREPEVKNNNIIEIGNNNRPRPTFAPFVSSTVAPFSLSTIAPFAQLQLPPQATFNNPQYRRPSGQFDFYPDFNNYDNISPFAQTYSIIQPKYSSSRYDNFNQGDYVSNYNQFDYRNNQLSSEYKAPKLPDLPKPRPIVTTPPSKISTNKVPEEEIDTANDSEDDIEDIEMNFEVENTLATDSDSNKEVEDISVDLTATEENLTV